MDVKSVGQVTLNTREWVNCVALQNDVQIKKLFKIILERLSNRMIKKNKNKVKNRFERNRNKQAMEIKRGDG